MPTSSIFCRTTSHRIYLYAGNMEGNNTSNILPQRKRRRPPLACERCRQQKIKCGREIPCLRCVQARKAPCIYTPDDRLTRKSPAAISNSVAQATSQVGFLATPPYSSTSASLSTTADPFHMWSNDDFPASFPPLHDSRHSVSSTISSQRRVTTHSYDSEDQEDLQVVSSLRAISHRLQTIEEKLFDANTGQVNPTESRLSDEGKLSETEVFSKTRLFGQSNWRNSIYQVRERKKFSTAKFQF